MLSSFKRLKDLAALSVVLTAFSVTPIEALDLKDVSFRGFQNAAYGGSGSNRLIAQRNTDESNRLDGRVYSMQGGGEPDVSPGGAGNMSGRFRKYMQAGDELPGGGGQDNGFRGGGMRRRFQGMSPEARQQIQEKLQGMSPDERRQFVQQMRQRRGQGGPGAMPGSASSPSPRPGLGGGDGGGGREMLPGGDMRRGLREQSGASGPGRGGSRARPGGMQGGRQWFGRQPIRLDRLNLSEKQKQRIQTMRQGNATRAREVNKQLRSKRAHLKEMLFDPGASQEQILEQQAQYSTLRNQADEIMLNDFLGIRSVLTKEQLNRLPEIKPGTRTKTGTASKKSSRAK